MGDVDEALVGAALKLLAAVLVLVDGPQDGDDLSLIHIYQLSGGAGGAHQLGAVAGMQLDVMDHGTNRDVEMCIRDSSIPLALARSATSLPTAVAAATLPP